MKREFKDTLNNPMVHANYDVFYNVIKNPVPPLPMINKGMDIKMNNKMDNKIDNKTLLVVTTTSDKMDNKIDNNKMNNELNEVYEESKE